VMPTLVLIDRSGSSTGSPAGFLSDSAQGVGLFHVRGTSCVDERVLFGPGRRLLQQLAG
jgi:hypothetical protein